MTTGYARSLFIESLWVRWRLLALETRMEACRMNGCQGGRRRVGIRRKEKAGAVRTVRALRAELGTEHGTTARVSSQLGYGVESVRSWVKQADIDDGLTVGMSTAEADRIKQLEQEIRELATRQRDIEACGVFLPGGAGPPAQEMTAFIDANRGDVIAGRRLGVERICKALQIHPSSYYATKSRPPSARSVSDSRLRPALRGCGSRTTRYMGCGSCGKQPEDRVSMSAVTRSRG